MASGIELVESGVRGLGLVGYTDKRIVPCRLLVASCKLQAAGCGALRVVQISHLVYLTKTSHIERYLVT